MPDTLESHRTKRGAQGYGGRNEGECGVPPHRTTPSPNPQGGPVRPRGRVKLRDEVRETTLVMSRLAKQDSPCLRPYSAGKRSCPDPICYLLSVIYGAAAWRLLWLAVHVYETDRGSESLAYTSSFGLSSFSSCSPPSSSRAMAFSIATSSSATTPVCP